MPEIFSESPLGHAMAKVSSTPDGEIAAHHAAETEKYVAQTRQQLEEVDHAIGLHEHALHSLSTRRTMLVRALSVFEDDQPQAAPMPQRGY